MQISDKRFFYEANLLTNIDLSKCHHFRACITCNAWSAVLQNVWTTGVFILLSSERGEGKERQRERERASVWSHLQFKRNIGFVANKVAGFFIIVFDCKDSSRSVELDSRLWRDVVLVVVSSLLGLPIESSKESLSVSRRSLPSDVPIIPRYAIFGCSNRLSQKTVRRTTATILLCCVVLLYAIGLILCALGVFIFVPIVFLFFLCDRYEFAQQVEIHSERYGQRSVYLYVVSFSLRKLHLARFSECHFKFYVIINFLTLARSIIRLVSHCNSYRSDCSLLSASRSNRITAPNDSQVKWEKSNKT